MAFALALDVPAPLERPAIVVPGAREVAFGTVAGQVGRGTHTVTVVVNGEKAVEGRVEGRRFRFRVALPPDDFELGVVASDALGNRAGTRVAPVLGLPRAAAARSPAGRLHDRLAAAVDDLVDGFAGISAVYVQDLVTGAGAAWNARARFPAASTVKLAIAVEVLRRLAARPPPDSSLDRLLELMLAHSDNEAANALLEWLGGSAEGGAAEVSETLAALGLGDSYLYGGFLTGGAGRAIPLTVENQPSFEGKYTTAWDLAQLHRLVHLAANGRGPLPGGGFSASDARFVLWVLAHSADRGKLDRYVGDEAVVPHKAGWVSEARHDAGIVYWEKGAIVVAVMTYTGGDAGVSSDELAGRIAEAALAILRDSAATANSA
jgi:beta-lactamase class A